MEEFFGFDNNCFKYIGLGGLLLFLICLKITVCFSDCCA